MRTTTEYKRFKKPFFCQNCMFSIVYGIGGENPFGQREFMEKCRLSQQLTSILQSPGLQMCPYFQYVLHTKGFIIYCLTTGPFMNNKREGQ